MQDSNFLYFGGNGAVDHDVRLYQSNDDLFIENQRPDNDISFIVNDGGTTSDILFLDGDTSNVGMGTTSPQADLEIATESLSLIHI